MALIKCPECGKEISDKSKACIHCGYPLEEVSKEMPKQYCVVLLSVNAGKKLSNFAALHRADPNITVKDSEQIINSLPYVVKTHMTYEEALGIKQDFYLADADAEIKEMEGDSVSLKSVKRVPLEVFCPKCKSTQITTGARGFSLFTGFIGSGKTVNRCGKCGYQWTPGK